MSNEDGDNVPLTISSMNSSIQYYPTDAWDTLPAVGATDGEAWFLVGDQVNGLANAYITYTFPEAVTAMQYWGYQRDNGGLYAICFDCLPSSKGPLQMIEGLNTSLDGNEGPRMLFQTTSIPLPVHNLTLINLFDSRATINGATNGSYGEMTLDRFVLFAAASPTTSTSISTTVVTTGIPAPSASPTPSASTSDTPVSSSKTGTIAGSVVGALAVLALLCLLAWFLLRCRRRLRQEQPYLDSMTTEEGSSVGILGRAWSRRNPGVQPFLLGMPGTMGAHRGGRQQHSTYGEYTSGMSTISGPRALPHNSPAISSPKLQRQQSYFPMSRPASDPTIAPSRSPSVYPVSLTATTTAAYPVSLTSASTLVASDAQAPQQAEPRREVVLRSDYEDVLRRKRDGAGRQQRSSVHVPGVRVPNTEPSPSIYTVSLT